MSKCSVKGCKNYDNEVIYYSRPVCYKHWISHCSPTGHTKLKELFNIKDEESKNLKTITSMEGIV